MQVKSYVTVAIATFRRPRELARLLATLATSCAVVAELVVDVVVVDNDPEASASQVCEDFAALDLRYVVQPIPGISATRNAGIECATGEFIVFLDDDEFVAEDWLRELFIVLRATEADLVAGPVLSLLPDQAPRAVRESGLFDRPVRADRSNLDEAGSGNLLVRLELFRRLPQRDWFRLEFGLSGGSDSELTRRLRRSGAKIVWASKALVWEEVPESRTSFRWLARRFRRVGSVDYRLQPAGRFRRISGLVSGLARIVTGATRLALIAILRRRVDAAAFRRLFRGVGFVESALGSDVMEYKRSPVVRG